MATQNRFFNITDEGDAFDLSLYQDGAQVAGGISQLMSWALMVLLPWLKWSANSSFKKRRSHLYRWLRRAYDHVLIVEFPQQGKNNAAASLIGNVPRNHNGSESLHLCKPVMFS